MDIRYHSTAASLLDSADLVRPHPENYNNGDVDAIRAAILEVGCYRPVYAWRETGEVLAGNNLYAALMELEQTAIPIAWVEANTREEAIKIVLGDNRIAALGQYDEALLLQMLESLDGDLEGTGYVPDDVDSIRALMDSANWDGDKPGGGHGDPDEDAFNPRIDLRVPPQTFDGWRRLLDTQTGKDDAEKLTAYLTEHGHMVEVDPA